MGSSGIIAGTWGINIQKTKVMQTLNAAVGNYNVQFEAKDLSAVKANLNQRGVKVLDGAVAKGAFLENTEVKIDMRITTFGNQSVNLNANDAVNRVYESGGVWYCDQYEANNYSFDSNAGAQKFINWAYDNKGWTVYNRGCSARATGGSTGTYVYNYSQW